LIKQKQSKVLIHYRFYHDFFILSIAVPHHFLFFCIFGHSTNTTAKTFHNPKYFRLNTATAEGGWLPQFFCEKVSFSTLYSDIDITYEKG